MYDFASLNAARRHKHKGHRHHRNRAGGGMFSMTEAKMASLTKFGMSKIAEGGISALLGAMDGNTGEAVFFQSTDASGKVDPTSGVGLKALLALTTNAAELVRLFAGHSFGAKMGLLGEVIDGTIEGAASASWCSWSYLQGLTYGKAKRLAAAGPLVNTKGRVDYRSRELGAGGVPQGQGHAAPQTAARSSGVDWYYRNFAKAA